MNRHTRGVYRINSEYFRTFVKLNGDTATGNNFICVAKLPKSY